MRRVYFIVLCAFALLAHGASARAGATTAAGGTEKGAASSSGVGDAGVGAGGGTRTTGTVNGGGTKGAADASAAPQGPRTARGDGASAGVIGGKPTAPSTPAVCTAVGTASGQDGLLLLGKVGAPGNLQVRLGDILVMRATGEFGRAVCLEFAKPQASRNLSLYLDGVRMTALRSLPFDITEQGVTFGFSLDRDANVDDNRKAWDALLKSKDNIEMKLQAAVAVGNEPPRQAQSQDPGASLEFYVAKARFIYWIFWIGVVVFLISYVLIVKRTRMLRDADTGFYSLGKSQMAFWGLLVLLSFFGVWILTGTMERIPPQTLVLLGISGATGLAAIFIGGDNARTIESKIVKTKAELGEFAAAKASLDQARASGQLTDADEARLTALNADIEVRTHKLRALTPRNFWYDIVNDGNGISFHRAQVVAWTLVLGIVFLGEVRQVISMPEFPESLLVLMGISNATYLGFKIPEKTSTQG